MAAGVIDAHLHLPLRQAGGDPAKAAKLLLREMDEAGVDYAIVIAIEASWTIISKHVDADLVKRAAEPFMYDWKAINHPTIYSALTEPRKLLSGMPRVLERHLAPSEVVVEAAHAGEGRLLAVASYCRLRSVEDYIERLEALRRAGPVIGVKLYPTLHFLRPDDPVLEPLYDYMEGEGLALIVHTGCDPGIWELPAFCTTANPRHLEPIARKHKDLTIIAAHMGSYSYLQPGIFFAEAIRVARNNPNVYLDSSATTLYQVKRALEKLPRDKILYGSDYPYYAGTPISEVLSAYTESALPERVKDALLWENAESVLATLGVKVTGPRARQRSMG